MKHIKHILLVIFMVTTCANTTQPQVDKNEDWREKYGIIPGTGAIKGQVKIDNLDYMYIEFISQKSDSIYHIVETDKENGFIVFNVLPGYYKCIFEPLMTTLLDSIPVKPDSMTILLHPLGFDEPLPYPAPPPPNIEGRFMDMVTDPITDKWIIIPIDN